MPDTAPTPTLLAVLEKVIPDMEENKAKKRIKRKKHLCIVNVLRKSVQATTITKHIFNLGLNFTVSKLLASAPAIEKQLTKAISKDETVQFQVNA